MRPPCEAPSASRGADLRADAERPGAPRPYAPAMDRLVRDVRCGLRQLRARPRVAAVAVLLLAVGVGGSTAAFSLVQGLLFRPLPYPDSETLVGVGRASRERPGDPLLSDSELR